MTRSDPIESKPSESLTFAVRAVARQAGFEIDHAGLREALGWPESGDDPTGVRGAARAEACGSLLGPGTIALGRSFRLIEAGKRFGMQIREVHPPEAARGLEDAPEFEQHFDASYRPLILRALENRQSVLAFRGWAGERERSWGWIRSACNEGVGFRGSTIWSEQELETLRDDLLVRPAVQVYVIERVTPS